MSASIASPPEPLVAPSTVPSCNTTIPWKTQIREVDETGVDEKEQMKPVVDKTGINHVNSAMDCVWNRAVSCLPT